MTQNRIPRARTVNLDILPDITPADTLLLQNVLNGLEQGYLQMDSTGVIVRINQRAAEMLGLPENSIVGKNLSKFCQAELLAPLMALLKNESSQDQSFIEILSASNNPMTVSVRGAFIQNENGLNTGFWLLMNNGTGGQKGGEQSTRVAKLMKDRTSAKEARERAEFLADASTVLSSSLEPETTLSNFANLVVPRFADWCTVFVRTQGQISPLVIFHSDPQKVAIAKQMHSKFPVETASRDVAVSAALTGQSILIERVTDSFLKRYTVNNEHLKIYRSLGIRSYISTPVVARGDLIGAISYATAESKRHFGAPDLIFAEDLARRACIAMDNVLLYQETKKAEEQLKSSLKEKSVLLQEVHHRVKNNLQVISSLLNMQARLIEDPAVLKIFEDSRNRIRAMALIHEKIYGADDLSSIRFDDYLKTLTYTLFQSYSTDGKRIQLDIQIEEMSLDIGKAVPVGLITNELISNALKYAFPETNKGTIQIKLQKVSDRTVALEIKDDGVGLPAELDYRTTDSLGLRLTNLLVRQLSGTIALIPQDSGTAFRIVFPL
jgi:two-component sensor histidine kinase/PAS domain-containing protein